MNVRVLASAQQASEECGRNILVLLEDAMAAGATPTLAISGGSSPIPMFSYFARTDFPWERVHLFFVDERAVPPDHPQSNFRLANALWLAPVKFPAANLHRIQAELPPSEAARLYEADIRRFFGLTDGQLPSFEVMHRGMGPDGHTASLFPGEAKIADRSGIASAVWAPSMNQWRITLLPGVLEHARHTAMLVTGADKVPALDAIFYGANEPSKYPAQIGANDALWFLDQPAGRAVKTTS